MHRLIIETARLIVSHQALTLSAASASYGLKMTHSVVYYLFTAYAIVSGLIAISCAAFIVKTHLRPKPKARKASITLVSLGSDRTGIRSEQSQ
jgi:hypothetical protein